MRRLLSPFGQVVLLVLALTVFEGAYALFRKPQSSLAFLISAWSVPLYVALWLQADARNRSDWPGYDFGAFVFFGWPLAVP